MVRIKVAKEGIAMEFPCLEKNCLLLPFENDLGKEDCDQCRQMEDR